MRILYLFVFRRILRRVIFYLKLIIKRQEIVMAKIDDLNSAVSKLQTTTGIVLTRIEELKQAPNQDPAIEAATVALNQVESQLSAAVATPTP